jgi:hypothetical protein
VRADKLHLEAHAHRHQRLDGFAVGGEGANSTSHRIEAGRVKTGIPLTMFTFSTDAAR